MSDVTPKSETVLYKQIVLGFGEIHTYVYISNEERKETTPRAPTVPIRRRAECIACRHLRLRTAHRLPSRAANLPR